MVTDEPENQLPRPSACFKLLTIDDVSVVDEADALTDTSASVEIDSTSGSPASASRLRVSTRAETACTTE